MADLGLYNNLIEHAIALERLQYRRRSAALRGQEMAFQMPDDEFVGLFRLTKPVTLDLINEIEPYLPGLGGGIGAVSKPIHDAYIWSQHPLKVHLESLDEPIWQLGDSGYALRPTLLTPIVTTEPGTPQRYYTNKHVRVRNTVERCIGLLKSRWRCLLVDRKLHYHPTTAGYITNAYVVLHNIANSAKVPDAHLSPEEEQNELSLQTRENYQDVEPQSLAAGERERNSLIERLWAAHSSN